MDIPLSEITEKGIKNFKQKIPMNKLKNTDILSSNDIKISSEKLNKFAL